MPTKRFCNWRIKSILFYSNSQDRSKLMWVISAL